MTGTVGEGRHRGIVVGIDDSAPAANAYRWAALRTDRFGPVTPVAAWHNPWWYLIGAPMIAPDGPGPDIERDARRMIDDLVARAPDGLRADPIVAQGSAGRVLCDIARDAALLVVGTRGRGAVADHVLGSVSSYYATHSPVPVVVVPENRAVEAATGSVVVGFDGSPGAEDALDWALRYAGDEGRVVACQAWDIPVITGYESIAIDPTVVRDATLQSVTEGAAAACARAGVPATRIEPQAAEGDARVVLEALAADADLVVVGRRGHRRVAHAVLGSVSSALVHRPVAPLVVIPPDAS